MEDEVIRLLIGRVPAQPSICALIAAAKVGTKGIADGFVSVLGEKGRPCVAHRVAVEFGDGALFDPAAEVSNLVRSWAENAMTSHLAKEEVARGGDGRLLASFEMKEVDLVGNRLFAREAFGMQAMVWIKQNTAFPALQRFAAEALLIGSIALDPF